MNRSVPAVMALCMVLGCATGPEGAIAVAPAEFTGTWRSVTPSLEFIRLTVSTQPRQAGVVAARLTFSGVAWEGEGRIEGDSLVADMIMAGTATRAGVLVSRASDSRTLQAELRPTAGPAFAVTLVRD